MKSYQTQHESKTHKFNLECYHGKLAAPRHFIDRYILEFDDTLLPEAPDVNREFIERFQIKIASLNLKGSNQFFRE